MTQATSHKMQGWLVQCTFALILLVILFGALHAARAAAAAPADEGVAAPAAASQGAAAYVNADGTLKTGVGAQARVDVSGWQVTLDPLRGPILAPRLNIQSEIQAGIHTAEQPKGWSPLGTGITSTVRAIAIAGTDVYVGGQFASIRGCTGECKDIAKWDGTAWSALGTGTDQTVEAIAITGTEVYVGGSFSNAGSCSGTCNGTAKWDGTSWSARNNGNGETIAIALVGTDVYVGGRFNNVLGCTTGCKGVAKWDGAAWAPLGTGIDRGPSDPVLAVAAGSDAVFAGGVFAGAGSCTTADGCQNIARYGPPPGGLASTKTVTPQVDVAYGGVVTYTLVVTNSGGITETAVQLSDVLPAQTHFGAWLQNPGAAVTGDAITWQGDIAPASTITFAFTAGNIGGASTDVTNRTVITGATGSITSTAVYRTQAGGLIVTALPLLPVHGTAAISLDQQTVIYTPTTVFSGYDSFTYTVTDTYGSADSALATVIVTPKTQTSAPPQIAPVDPQAPAAKQFTSAHATISVELPGGFYTGTVTGKDILVLSYTPILTPTSQTGSPPGSLSFGGLQFDLTLFLNNQPQSGVQFAVPITLTIVYDPALLTGLNAATLAVYFWNGTAWSTDGIDVVSRDGPNHAITIAVHHLSDFAFFAAVPTGEEPRPEPALHRELFLPSLSK